MIFSSFQNSSGRFKTSNGFIGLPHHVSQGSGCQMRGQNCYVEVTLGCPRSGSDNALQSNTVSMRNLPKNHVAESPAVGRGDQKGSPDQLPVYEKTFIYPAEAVLVPVLHTSFARSSLKRFFKCSTDFVYVSTNFFLGEEERGVGVNESGQ